LERCARSAQGLSLLFVDLDNFKGVNDRLGHSMGDALLKEVGRRLSRSARAVDTVCRLSGDEFTVVMENAGSGTLGEAGAVARRIIDALSEPFELCGHTINVSASIGISIYPADGTDADALIRHADDALYRAKQSGKNKYQYFSAMLDGGARGNAARDMEQATSVDKVSTG
jgi:diguanylate cyclase (GGDEF)-like protein